MVTRRASSSRAAANPCPAGARRLAPRGVQHGQPDTGGNGTCHRAVLQMCPEVQSPGCAFNRAYPDSRSLIHCRAIRG